MKMTNRELETRYMHMKQTWKTLVDANVSLVDENKDLKEEIERLNKSLLDIKEIIDVLETYSSNQDVLNDYNKRASKIRYIVNKALGSDKE